MPFKFNLHLYNWERKASKAAEEVAAYRRQAAHMEQLMEQQERAIVRGQTAGGAGVPIV